MSPKEFHADVADRADLSREDPRDQRHPSGILRVRLAPLFVFRGVFCRVINRSSRSVVNTVEQQLKRPVRLRPERDFRPDQYNGAFAECRFDRRNSIAQIMLAPCPSAAQWLVRVEPSNWL